MIDLSVARPQNGGSLSLPCFIISCISAGVNGSGLPRLIIACQFEFIARLCALVPPPGFLARIEVLVLDDFLLAPMKDSELRDLLEILEDRYNHSSTVINSQVPTKRWHELLTEPTLADAICDRLVHNAHVLALQGPRCASRKATVKPTSTR